MTGAISILAGVIQQERSSFLLVIVQTDANVQGFLLLRSSTFRWKASNSGSRKLVNNKVSSVWERMHQLGVVPECC